MSLSPNMIILVAEGNRISSATRIVFDSAAELHYVTGISVHILLVLLQIFHSEAAGYPGHRYMVLVEQVLPDLFLLFVGESVYGLLAQ